MALTNTYLTQPRVAWIAVAFALAIVGENVFGSSDTESIAGGFAASYSHFFYIGSALIGTVVLFFLFPGSDLRFPRFYLPYLFLAIYALLSSFWGTAFLKSAGLSLMLILNLIWAAVIGVELRRVPEGKRFRAFVDLWAVLFIINFCIENIIKGAFANLDEFSIMAMILSYMLLRLRSFTAALIVFILSLSGQSFSAILGFFLFIIAHKFFRISNSKKIFSLLLIGIIVFLTLHVEWLGLLEESGIRIFGKNSNGIISGSGRFNAWQAVYDAILASSWSFFLFGHGYATDRDVLTQAGLTWSVDVHNNVLHMAYGLGLIGLLLFIWALIWSIRLAVLRDFRKYLLPILIAFLFFGFSSSYFFGRPSYMAIFWLTFLTAGVQVQQKKHRTDPLSRVG